MKRIIISTTLLILFSSAIVAQVGIALGLDDTEIKLLSEANKKYDIGGHQSLEYYTDKYILWFDETYAVSDTNSKRLEKILSMSADIRLSNVDIKAVDINDYLIFSTLAKHVRVSEGLMNLMTDDELFAIIITAIAHCECKIAEDIMNVSLVSLADDIVEVKELEGLVLEANWDLFSDIEMSKLNDMLLSVRYPLETNQIVDDYAYSFLYKEKKGTKALLSAFKKIEDVQNNISSNTFENRQLFSIYSHCRERIERLEGKIAINELQ